MREGKGPEAARRARPAGHRGSPAGRQRQRAPSAKGRPTAEQLRAELERERGNRRLGQVLRSTVYTLVVVAAVAVLVAVLLLPVFRIYGSSMKGLSVNTDFYPLTYRKGTIPENFGFF